MNYRETLDFLFERFPAYQRVGKAAYKATLENTLALDCYFGSPHNNFPSVHIAGTNGKGSVSHMMASVLQESGLRTGLYTSPHLRDFRERIKVNGEMIPEEEVVLFVSRHREMIEDVSPSFFEMTVALAFDYFSRMRIDIAVVETGMGGRLDSTNIITPVLSVITNIGHDHMEFLGDSLEKVAAEKAGIVKPGVPVVIGETDSVTSPVFARFASKNGSPLYFADRNYESHFGNFNSAIDYREFELKRLSDSHIIKGKTPLTGDYQIRNMVTLIQSMDVMPDSLGLTEEHIVRGMMKVRENTALNGRWQILRREPLVICDTAHNREGLEFVVRQLLAQKYEKLHLVLGFVNDKDLSSVLPLFPKEAHYYFTRASVLRSLNEDILRDEAARYGLEGLSWSDVPAAFNSALGSAGKEDLIFIGGSTFIVADMV